jgi:hypothetical protein
MLHSRVLETRRNWRTKPEWKGINGNTVIMFHGDLLTMERLQSLLLYRSIEETPFWRCQYLIFIPGMFHLKMVAVEAIWKIYISYEPKHHDETSLMQSIQLVHPNETRCFKMGPKFCCMHKVIGLEDIVQQLEFWWQGVQQKQPTINTLEEYVKCKPEWEEIIELSNELTSELNALTEHLNHQCVKGKSEHDLQ